MLRDDKVDVMSVQRAFKAIHVTNRIEVVSNGEEALSHLRNSANRRPCITLLDLNMPKMNGIEFLKVKKQDEMMRNIPTVVLTTSREEQDKVNSFNLGVAGYMIKPVEYKKFVVVAKTIEIYWTLSELPGEG